MSLNGSMVICTYSVHITMANFSAVLTSKTYSGIAPQAHVMLCHLMSCHVMSEKTFNDS